MANHALSPAVGLIEHERIRQIQVERYSAEHDDAHCNGELAMAAACYASPHPVFCKADYKSGVAFLDPWPFDKEYDRRGEYGPVRRLVVAAALIAAEIDRLLREKDRAAH